MRVRIWVLQWEGRKKRKPPRTPVKSFINFLILTVSRKGVVARINLTATGNVATPAETEIACRMNGYSLVYSRARFVQWTECVVFLNEGMGWVKRIVRGTFALFSGGGGGIFVDIRSSGLDRVVVKLFLLRSISLPEAEQGKVNGAFME